MYINLQGEPRSLGSCDCMRNDSNLTFACNRYTLLRDLKQCLHKQLQTITSSDDVLANSSNLELVHNIATSLRLLHRMAELFNNIEVSN